MKETIKTGIAYSPADLEAIKKDNYWTDIKKKVKNTVVTASTIAAFAACNATLEDYISDTEMEAINLNNAVYIDYKIPEGKTLWDLFTDVYRVSDGSNDFGEWKLALAEKNPGLIGRLDSIQEGEIIKVPVNHLLANGNTLTYKGRDISFDRDEFEYKEQK